MPLPPSPYRAPGHGRTRTGSRRPLDRGFLYSLLVLAAWAALRVASSAARGQLDGEAVLAVLLLALALHGVVRCRPVV